VTILLAFYKERRTLEMEGNNVIHNAITAVALNVMKTVRRGVPAV